jgi:uncharacterized membrane protein
LVTTSEPGPRLNLGPFSPLFYRVGATGSRDLLGAIAGSMLAVASTTFSITIAVLALTSSTYGARLVRNFMTDRVNQAVLGVFVATFLYSLLVLRSIHSVETSADSPDEFVPHLAVNIAVVMAVVAIGFLVWFIHHISSSIQVWKLSARVREELWWTVNRLYPEHIGADAAEEARERAALPVLVGGARVVAPRAGYVVTIRQEGLLDAARRHDVVVTLSVRPGHFCVEGTELASVHPGDRTDVRVLRDVAATINLADSRSPEQDVEFATQQLVEMLIRALSPGTNDPYTATNALDSLSAGLCLLMSRPMPSPARYDEDGALRVVAPAVAPADPVNLVFDAVRVYAMEYPTVLHSAVDLADRLTRARDPRTVDSLDIQLDLLLDGYARTDPHPRDMVRLRDRVDEVRDRLGTAHSSGADVCSRQHPPI